LAWDLYSATAVDTLLKDVRYAARTLRARPGFTLTAAAMLAAGIGGSTAIFSLASAVLLGKLPFRDPERLVMVWHDASAIGFPRTDLTPASYAALRAGNQVFEELAAVAQNAFTLTGGGEPEKVEGRRVTASFFPVLGIAPQLGRVFGPDDDRPGADRVTVLSHGLWQRRFGGDPDVVGRDILLNGEKHTVIGIMPAGFQFFESYVGLWVPAAFGPDELSNRGGHYLHVVGRMKTGVDVQRAQADIATIAARLVRDFPDQEFHAFVVPLREQLLGDARRPLIVLVLAITSVLLITCANIAGLLLARAASRGREIAVRTAIGATRGRIVRQLLTESFLLAAVGALPGVFVASWALSSLQPLIPPTLALGVHPTLDARALAVALALSAATGLLFGLAPALQLARSDLSEALRHGGRGSTGAAHRTLRSALVVAELGATVVLLVGAGLLGRTLYHLRYADLGLQPERLLTLRTTLPPQKYDEPSRRAQFYEAVLERVQHLPGVLSAGYSTSVPLEWKGGTSGFVPEGPVDQKRSYDANHRQVSADYLRTMGIPMRRGRAFERTDGARSQPVAIVNEAMARQYWPGVEALGKRFRIGDASNPWITIVGIAGDVRQMGLDAPVKAEMYLPYSQISDQPWFAPRDLAVRTTSDPMSLVPAIRQAIRTVDPEQAVSNIRTFDEVLDEEVVQRRLAAGLVAAFAALALLLASLGVYGVLSYFVTQHTAEIGVRLALGASRRDIFALVLGRGMALALTGAGLGVLSALALTRFVSSLLYGIRAADPATFGSAAAVLTALAFVACYLPARRAVRIDPMVAMRRE
jgi:putative ABC transport system permease protein